VLAAFKNVLEFVEDFSLSFCTLDSMDGVFLFLVVAYCFLCS